MIKGEKLYTTDGTQVMLFPLNYLYMSQDEGGDFSHAGTLCMDFLGWGENGRVYSQEYYAPCDLVCVYRSNTAYYNIWNSVNPVYCADGVTRNLCIMNIHGNMLFNIGDKVSQGDVMGVTGAYGQATGDHAHLNVANGHYAGQEQVPPNNAWQLKNSIHMYDACFCNDTVIVRGFGHDWRDYEGGYTPPVIYNNVKKKYPWVLYARRNRSKIFR